jgi:hypothetical protein
MWKFLDIYDDQSDLNPFSGNAEVERVKNVTDSSLDSLQIDENRCQRNAEETGPVTAATC